MNGDTQIRFAKLLLKWLSVLLVLKVTFNILSNYPGYFPPDFQVDFLQGREGYFHGAYRVAFYTHILTTPCVILSGLLLLNARFRNRAPGLHRGIGRCHVVAVLLGVVPSGLVMSAYAFTGFLAGLGFAILALVTGACAAMGWRLAVQGRFEEHRQWMIRCFLLLCSAIALRLISGMATITNADPEWTYPLAAWSSWILPLVGFELLLRRKKLAAIDRDHRA